MWIDTHCHLNFRAFNQDLHEVVRRARKMGVEKIIVPGTDLISSKKAIEIARQFSGICYAAVGIHPHHAQNPKLKVNDQLKNQLDELISKEADKIVAIGEIGLDYYRYRQTKYETNVITEEIKQKQLQLLNLQLNLAVIHNLPLILHCRQAWPKLLEVMSQYPSNNSRIVSDDPLNQNQSATQDPLLKTNYHKPAYIQGVFHCFSGSKTDLQTILTMGYFVGFDGNITYSDSYEDIVISTPLERLLIETDSPYLTPIPHRRQRNEPAFLPYVAQQVAKFHHTSLSHIKQITTSNALKLFHLN